MNPDRTPVVIGGGIGGLAAALACARAGLPVQLFEQASAFSEVGAGIQLGPNAVRVLQAWGLDAALRAVAVQPQELRVCDALHGRTLATLPLGAAMEQRYGAPYWTLARADLHAVLLDAALGQARVSLALDHSVRAVAQESEGLRLSVQRADASLTAVHTPLLVGADGLWSRVRASVAAAPQPRSTGHLAYRSLLRQADLPSALRSQRVTVWLGPDFHVVQYPVRAGAWLNVVALVQAQAGAFAAAVPAGWDHAGNAADLQFRLQRAARALQDVLHAVPQWRLWALNDCVPLPGPQAMVQGRIALLGDAAHPMRPYLAQGAGMALEDAAQLGACLGAQPQDFPGALQRYAALRWQRNARVQARAERNGRVFHLQGAARLARNMALRLGGAALLDAPWLYAGP